MWRREFPQLDGCLVAMRSVGGNLKEATVTVRGRSPERVSTQSMLPRPIATFGWAMLGQWVW